MNKKFLTILLVSVFLITSLGVISANDNADYGSVKIVWDDNVNVKPDYVTVNLIKDGKIVDTVKLSEENSWKTKFNIGDEGNYKVNEIISSNYSTDIKGNVSEGFVIKNKLVENEVLGAVNDEDSLKTVSNNENDSNNDTVLTSTNSEILSDASTGNLTANGTESGNSTGNNANSTDTNSTKNSTVTDNSDDGDNSKAETKTTKITKVVTKKVVKDKEKKKPTNTTKLKGTGFPIVVLVVALFVVALVPFYRKK